MMDQIQKFCDRGFVAQGYDSHTFISIERSFSDILQIHILNIYVDQSIW